MVEKFHNLVNYRFKKPSLGSWLHCPTPESAELMSLIGFDFLVIDNQHGLTDLAKCVELIRTVTSHGVPAFVRVSSRNFSEIGKFLDAGAMGIICPMINNEDEARDLVAASLYHPKGKRSFGPIRSRLIFKDLDINQINEKIIVLPMIETHEALQNIEKIINVPGISGFFMGPSDMALSNNLIPTLDPEEDKSLELLKKAVESVKDAKKISAIAIDKIDFLPKAQNMGYNTFICGSDLKFLERGALAVKNNYEKLLNV